MENLPKTNNDLEQVFGSFRHHQRRTTGRKKAPASLLIRGESRLMAAVVTRIKTKSATDLATADLVAGAKATFTVGTTATKTSSTTSFSSFSWKLFTGIGNQINPVNFATLEKNKAAEKDIIKKLDRLIKEQGLDDTRNAQLELLGFQDGVVNKRAQEQFWSNYAYKKGNSQGTNRFWDQKFGSNPSEGEGL